MADVNRRLEEKELTIELTEAAKDCIVEGGYDPMYGAKPLKRYLQKNVETLAARLILIPRGMDTTATLGMAALSVIIGALIGSIMIPVYVILSLIHI